MPTSDEVIEQLGTEFADTLTRNRREAWSNLIPGLMRNLAVLAKSHSTQGLRDVISIVMEVDKTVLGGAVQGNKVEPLDAIADRWTMKEDGENDSTKKE